MGTIGKKLASVILVVLTDLAITAIKETLKKKMKKKWF